MAKKPNLTPNSAPSRVTASTKAPQAPAKHRKAKTAEAPTPEQPAVPTFTITREDIATLAFSYWESRGYQGGSSQDDWDRAERHLRSLLS